MSENPAPETQLRVTDEAVLAACRAHTPQFDRLDPEISKYAVAQMRAALHAALTTERMEAPHGWVCFNSGPTEWFWSEKREALEHELSDDIRPATHLEKYFFNKQGNQTHEHDIAPPETNTTGWQDIGTAPDGTSILLRLSNGEVFSGWGQTENDGSRTWKRFHATSADVGWLNAKHWSPMLPEPGAPTAPPQNRALGPTSEP